MKNKSLLPLLLSTLLVFSCSSSPDKPDAPAWIHAPARSVDNGYIVYVAKADGKTSERAQFKAEGLALEDMANECSLIPKGARIEDRYVEDVDHKSFNAYIKIGLEFQVCETAKKTIQPDEIKNLASLPFSEQLKKYQDLAETGEMPTEVAAVEPPAEYAPAPARQAGYDDNVHFFVTRQYVAYQKQIVVLSPPTAYAPGSADNQRFVSAVSPSVSQIQTTEQQNPALVKQPTTWSTLGNRPVVSRPQSLAAAPRHQMSSQPMRMMQNPNRGGGRAGGVKPPGKGGRGRGRKHKKRYQDE